MVSRVVQGQAGKREFNLRHYRSRRYRCEPAELVRSLKESAEQVISAVCCVTAPCA